MIVRDKKTACSTNGGVGIGIGRKRRNKVALLLGFIEKKSNPHALLCSAMPLVLVSFLRFPHLLSTILYLFSLSPPFFASNIELRVLRIKGRVDYSVHPK